MTKCTTNFAHMRENDRIAIEQLIYCILKIKKFYSWEGRKCFEFFIPQLVYREKNTNRRKYQNLVSTIPNSFLVKCATDLK